MVRRFRELIISSVIICFILAIVGMIFINNPSGSLEMISHLLAVLLIILGIYLVAIGTNTLLISILPSGILSLIFGLLLLLNTKIISIFIPITIALMIIVKTISSLALCWKLKNVDFIGFLLTIVSSIICIVVASIILLNPYKASEILVVSYCLFMIICAMLSLLNIFILGFNEKSLLKEFK